MVPKGIEVIAGRNPPEPSAGHSGIDDWFGLLMPYIADRQGVGRVNASGIPGPSLRRHLEKGVLWATRDHRDTPYDVP